LQKGGGNLLMFLKPLKIIHLSMENNENNEKLPKGNQWSMYSLDVTRSLVSLLPTTKVYNRVYYPHTGLLLATM
jgi:hypothetical protein